VFYQPKRIPTANQLYKGVIGESAGVFKRKNFGEKDAQTTNAYQSNKNLLLSNELSSDATTAGDICDDVKGTHGAPPGEGGRKFV